MLLTLYYVYAMVVQWWRFSTVRAKLAAALADRASVVLYRNAPSETCGQGNIKDLLFYTKTHIGCSVMPQRKLDLKSWIAFPFDITDLFYGNVQDVHLAPVCFNLLLQVDARNDDDEAEYDTIQIENIGVPLAWSFDKRFSFLFRTDINKLVTIVSCYLSRPLAINDYMRLLRIENIEGASRTVADYSDCNRYWRTGKWDDFVLEMEKLSTPKIEVIVDRLTTVNPPKAEVREINCVGPAERSPNHVPKQAKNPGHRKDKNKADRNHKNEKDVRSKKENHVEKKMEKNENCETKAKETKPKKRRPHHVKPPNVLVYADSLATKENIKNVLQEILNTNRYVIYDLPTDIKNGCFWNDNATLVVVCGNVTPVLTPKLLEFFVSGGNMLCLCSDLLNSILHTFTTAEVREHELVRFSYGEWRRVRMMHHIFCYQASPVRKHFSQDSDQNSSNHSNNSSPRTPRTPSTVELVHNNKTYTVQVQVLGTEETWHTPSLLLASVKHGAGKVVFSQVHLEIDPTQYEDDESKYEALKQSNAARLQILKDILSNHLGLDCAQAEPSQPYTSAYFLGRNDLKQQMLAKMAGLADGILQNDKLKMQFCGKGAEPPAATENFLPILVHACPDHFSTVEYFENLQTKVVGRLVIYADVMTSSMDVLRNCKYPHGLAVLPRYQTNGTGRSKNKWISVDGCAMFSLQLNVPLSSALGQRLSMLQHLIAVSVVSALRSLPDYEDIDVGVKWPNDIYYDASVKIGGLVVNSRIEGNSAVCDVGCGINLNNKLPTTCINAIITKYNQRHISQLETFSYERFVALVFTEIERVLDEVQSGNMDHLYDLYYKYWLHSCAEITVVSSKGVAKQVTVIGIDDYGFLSVRSPDGELSSVQPDGNSFDMLQGLIAPKIL